MATPVYEGISCVPTEDWLELNIRAAREDPSLRQDVAPFPPAHLMQVVSGLTSEAEFAVRGATIYRAIQNASPVPLNAFKSILDFGCGCGGLSRLFKGHPGQVTGCDIDGRLIEWVDANLDFMRAVQTQPNEKLPFGDDAFDAVISNSVFTHLNEASQEFYLNELSRVSRPGASLFLTVHGDRALERAQNEEQIFNMIDIAAEELDGAASTMRQGLHSFVLQRHGHLTSEHYDYGITFIPKAYLQSVWPKYFDIVDIVDGAIDDWQDIVVCRKRGV